MTCMNVANTVSKLGRHQEALEHALKAKSLLLEVANDNYEQALLAPSSKK